MTKRKGRDISSDALEQELQEFEQGAVNDTPTEADLLRRNGLHIEAVTELRTVNKQQRTVTIGYVIVRTRTQGDDRQRALFAGRAMAWSSSKVSGIPFPSHADAINAATAYADAIERFAVQPTFAISQVTVRVPLAPIDEQRPIFPTKVSASLDVHETSVIDSLRRALRSVNAESRPGQPVDSNADAMRWLVQQLAQAVAESKSQQDHAGSR